MSETIRAPGPTDLPSNERDTQLRAALAVANVPILLMLLTQLTGNRRWLQAPYLPKPVRGLTDRDSGGLPDALQAEVREAAFEVLAARLDRRLPDVPEPSEGELLQLLSVSLGEPIPPEYSGMMRESLREVVPTLLDAPPPPNFQAVIIGAGASGICAAVKLRELGIKFTVFEKSSDLGGTWFENRYPGCAVDVPSHLYAYSFANWDWSYYFARRGEVHDYLESVADKFAIRADIKLDAEVLGAEFDVAAQRWSVRVRYADGRLETVKANILISGVGAFNPPTIPQLEGLADFAGPSFHTAKWPEGYSVANKKVAVIGNGASAMQVVPAIADEAKSVTIFQRTPQWAAPIEAKMEGPIPQELRFLIRAVPLYGRLLRLRQGWIFNDQNHPTLQKDPDWPHADRSLNAINDKFREYFTHHITSSLEGRPDLIEKTIPAYPPFGKRILIDHGWFAALREPNVELVTDPIARVTARGIETSAGQQYEADVIVFATGFDVVRFLSSLEIVGRSGRSLREAWDGDNGRAYLGMAVPDFPNFFMLYGPNTQSGHGGSVIFALECQMNYIQSLLAGMFKNNIGVVECRPDIHENYNQRVDKAHSQMVWTHPGVSSYYKNSRGRVVVNSPWRVVDFWTMTRSATLSDYFTELDLTTRSQDGGPSVGNDDSKPHSSARHGGLS